MKNIITSAVVALVVAFIVVGLVGGKSTKPLGGETNLDSLILTSKFAIGTTTVPISTQGDAVMDGPATTTLALFSSTANVGSCIQMENNLGTPTRLWVQGTTLLVQAGTCK